MKKGLLITGSLYLAFQLVLLAPSCTNVELPPPLNPAYCDTISITTYEGGVKTIIDHSCAYAGCHDGAGGIGPGNYNNYAGIQPYLSSGSVMERVVNLKNDPAIGMPPNQSVYPESHQDDLSEEDFEIMHCWLLNDHPEQ